MESSKQVDSEAMYKEIPKLYSLHWTNKRRFSKKLNLISLEYDIVIPGFKCNMPDIMKMRLV